ncbi:MAG: NAD(P)/FAD-dependent oxidoreductase [Suipraeoptans sp.]
MSNSVIIIGGGAAGMLAAISAAENGSAVTLIEKNEKLGKKLFITGKGRCNLTNICTDGSLIDYVVSNPKFLYSAFHEFNNFDTIDFFEKLGLKTKVERGGRVFPVSDKSSDVLKVLSKEINRLGVKVLLNTEVSEVIVTKSGSKIIKTLNNTFKSDKIIIATGGVSYKSTGSTGDGYKWARENNINVTPVIPALVPLEVGEQWIGNLQGLSLKNIKVYFYKDNKELYSEFGELLFTHYGVSGPVILTASSYLDKEIKKNNIELKIDLKPALSYAQLDQRLLREFSGNQNKQFKNVLTTLLPGKLKEHVSKHGPISGDKVIHEITKEDRQHFITYIKEFKLTITKYRSFDEAIITQGGVSVNEINPKTMQAKKLPGVYFAGEVLDLDAVTGGFNLQIAWSCAYIAGKQASLT